MEPDVELLQSIAQLDSELTQRTVAGAGGSGAAMEVPVEQLVTGGDVEEDVVVTEEPVEESATEKDEEEDVVMMEEPVEESATGGDEEEDVVTNSNDSPTEAKQLRQKRKRSTLSPSGKKTRTRQSKIATTPSPSPEEGEPSSIGGRMRKRRLLGVRGRPRVDFAYAPSKAPSAYSSNPQTSHARERRQMLLTDPMTRQIERAGTADRNAKHIALKKLRSSQVYKDSTAPQRDRLEKEAADKVETERYELGISKEYLTDQNEIEARRLRRKAEAQEEEDRAALFKEAYTKRLMGDPEEPVDSDEIMNKFDKNWADNLAVVIKHQERIINLQGKRLLHAAGDLNPEETMRRFRSQVMDPKHIEREDHEYILPPAVEQPDQEDRSTVAGSQVRVEMSGDEEDDSNATSMDDILADSPNDSSESEVLHFANASSDSEESEGQAKPAEEAVDERSEVESADNDKSFADSDEEGIQDENNNVDEAQQG